MPSVVSAAFSQEIWVSRFIPLLSASLCSLCSLSFFASFCPLVSDAVINLRAKRITLLRQNCVMPRLCYGSAEQVNLLCSHLNRKVQFSLFTFHFSLFSFHFSLSSFHFSVFSSLVARVLFLIPVGVTEERSKKGQKGQKGQKVELEISKFPLSPPPLITFNNP